jgi:polyribonucleotide nucleotidyltransferase
VLKGALDQARDARHFILGAMADVISEPRSEMNQWAPRIESVEIPKDKIGEIIGPKGAVIRELEEVTGAKIEIEEGDGIGIVRIASSDADALANAMERVQQIAFPPEAEIGAEYDGKVVNITKFGAFVNILPGRDGLLHISRLDGSKRVERVEDYLSDGDELKVRVREIDRGKVSLELVDALEGATLPSGGAPSGGGDRSGGRSGGRNRRDGGGGGNKRDNGGDRNREKSRHESSSSDGGGSDGGGSDGGGRRRPAQSFDEAFEKMDNQ